MLDKKIQFYKAVNVQDEDTGGMLNNPVLVLETWAEKKVYTYQYGGGKDIEAGETVMNDRVDWKIRKRASFTPDKSMYVLYKGQKHIIQRIIDKDERNEQFISVETIVQS